VDKVSLRVIFFVCALMGAVACQAFAQEATIVGTVTDPSVGDTIVGSQVTQLAANGQSIYGLTAPTGAPSNSHQRRLYA